MPANASAYNKDLYQAFCLSLTYCFLNEYGLRFVLPLGCVNICGTYKEGLE